MQKMHQQIITKNDASNFIETLTRRGFLNKAISASLGTASLLILSGEADAQSKSIRLFLRPEGNSETIAAGQPVTVGILKKTLFPRLSRVEFKANGQPIGTATNPNQTIAWQPAQAGNYVLTAEAFDNQSGVVAVDTLNLKVLTTLYDKIGYPGNWLWTNTNYFSGFQMVPNPQGRICTHWIGSLDQPTTLKRFETVMSLSLEADPTATIDLAAVYFKLRIWNTDVGGFWNNPFAPNVFQTNLNAQTINIGSSTIPIGVNPAGRVIFRIGWDNLNVPLPAATPLQISLQGEIDITNQRLVTFNAGGTEQQLIAVRVGSTFLNGFTDPTAARLVVST